MLQESTFVWDIGGGRRRGRRWRGGGGRGIVGEEAAGEKEGEGGGVGGGSGLARRRRMWDWEGAVGVAVEVGEEAPHRGGRQREERGAWVGVGIMFLGGRGFRVSGGAELAVGWRVCSLTGGSR